MRERRTSLTWLAYALIGAGVIVYGGVILAVTLTSLVLAGPLLLGAVFLFGLPVIGVGILVIKVIRDRMTDPEDRHYSRDIHQ